MGFSVFLPSLQNGTNFGNSCLLPWMIKSFHIVIYSQKNLLLRMQSLSIELTAFKKNGKNKIGRVASAECEVIDHKVLVLLGSSN